MRVALRLSRDLIAIRAPADKLPAGQLLRVGESSMSAVVCARAGVLLASVLPEGAGKASPDVAADASVTLLNGQVMRAPLGSGTLLGGRIIDCYGNVLDSGSALGAPEVPLFGTPPVQAQLKPIDRSLHTGTAAIDALTPIGRGQSMVILGEDGVLAGSKSGNVIVDMTTSQPSLAVEIAETVIGLTIVALGTSLPELAASVIAARRGEHDIAIGNVVGSNMFNLLAVIGIAGTINPLSSIAPEVLYRDWLTMIGLTLLLLAMAFGFVGQGRINRLEGLALLGCYSAYTTWLVLQATGQ